MSNISDNIDKSSYIMVVSHQSKTTTRQRQDKCWTYAFLWCLSHQVCRTWCERHNRNAQVQHLSCRCLVVVLLWCENFINLIFYLQFSLVCTMGYVTTLCTTFLMAGILVGASVGGQLADIYGRRPILIGATVFLILCQLCQSFSPNWKVFTAIRFIGGLSAGHSVLWCFITNIFTLTATGTLL